MSDGRGGKGRGPSASLGTTLCKGDVMTRKTERIGFIGLRTMGMPMVVRLRSHVA